MSHVRYSTADGIASIALARPPLNAFSIAFLDEVIAALRRAGGDPDVRAVDDFCEAAMSSYAQEGLAAFLEKRKPQWP